MDVHLRRRVLRRSRVVEKQMKFWCWLGRHDGHWGLPYAVEYEQSNRNGEWDRVVLIRQDRTCPHCGIQEFHIIERNVYTQ